MPLNAGLRTVLTARIRNRTSAGDRIWATKDEHIEWLTRALNNPARAARENITLPDGSTHQGHRPISREDQKILRQIKRDLRGSLSSSKMAISLLFDDMADSAPEGEVNIAVRDKRPGQKFERLANGGGVSLDVDSDHDDTKPRVAIVRVSNDTDEEIVLTDPVLDDPGTNANGDKYVVTAFSTKPLPSDAVSRFKIEIDYNRADNTKRQHATIARFTITERAGTANEAVANFSIALSSDIDPTAQSSMAAANPSDDWY